MPKSMSFHSWVWSIQRLLSGLQMQIQAFVSAQKRPVRQHSKQVTNVQRL
jgi:hypothetical protein